MQNAPNFVALIVMDFIQTSILHDNSVHQIWYFVSPILIVLLQYYL